MKYLIPLTLVMASLASATVVTTTVAGAAAIIIGAKILAGKGFVYGAAKATWLRSLRDGNRRGRRDIESDLSDAFLEASQKDQYDCAKSLICNLHAQPLAVLKDDELIIASTFGKMDAIDLTSASVEFDLAALLGRNGGVERCATIYKRCPMTPGQLMKDIRAAASS